MIRTPTFQSMKFGVFTGDTAAETALDDLIRRISANNFRVRFLPSVLLTFHARGPILVQNVACLYVF